MKWVLAGITFALAVGLAVATTQVQVHNLRCRARIEALNGAIMVLQVEHGRRAQRVEVSRDRQVLARTLLAWKVAPELE